MNISTLLITATITLGSVFPAYSAQNFNESGTADSALTRTSNSKVTVEQIRAAKAQLKSLQAELMDYQDKLDSIHYKRGAAYTIAIGGGLVSLFGLFMAKVPIVGEAPGWSTRSVSIVAGSSASSVAAMYYLNFSAEDLQEMKENAQDAAEKVQIAQEKYDVLSD